MTVAGKHNERWDVSAGRGVLAIGSPPHPNPPPQGGRESQVLISTPPLELQKDYEAPSPLVGEGRGGGETRSLKIWHDGRLALL